MSRPTPALIPESLCLPVPSNEGLRTLSESERWAWLGTDPVKTEAFWHRKVGKHDREYVAMARALGAAGWTEEVSDYTVDIMRWYWRSPPKRKGSKGRLYRSTDQAYNRLMRDSRECPFTLDIWPRPGNHYPLGMIVLCSLPSPLGLSLMGIRKAFLPIRDA